MTVTVGDQLPTKHVPITATLIAGGAIATGDWNLVHHDTAAAKAAGTPDIFMNILTTNGLVGGYVTEWAGPAARLTDVSIRLGAPNYPGDEMVFTGSVQSVDDETGTAVVAVEGKNASGAHVTGTVSLVLNGKESAA